MKNDNKTELTGVITDSYPNCTFNVKIDGTEKVVMCYLCGKMRENFIKIGLGDRVKFEIAPPFDRGRIIFREKRVVQEELLEGEPKAIAPGPAPKKFGKKKSSLRNSNAKTEFYDK